MTERREVDVVFLVVESSPQVRESLCHVLLSFGIRGVPVADRASALEVLKKSDQVEGAIVDIDNRDVEGIPLITGLKDDERTRGIPLIVHTIQAHKDTVMRMMDIGVAGYLLKPYSPETAKAKLAAVFSKLATHNSQRRHIRVKPDPDELARVSFRVAPPSQLVSGRIVDISLGGMAVELFNPPPAELLVPGAPLPRVTFSLPGRELAPSASVVLLKARILALKFDTMSATDKSALERYVFRSISS
jgi:two-component system chemotaxis response regulator CheY